jgi:hypothetical protein
MHATVIITATQESDLIAAKDVPLQSTVHQGGTSSSTTLLARLFGDVGEHPQDSFYGLSTA